ncbi:MAG: DPP IV N-terminal domain-containing protein, partial [Acidobacteriota bacterium]|nr:DPP IV N-terminal domain-containing protein [Acidobacteriota bacterium]
MPSVTRITAFSILSLLLLAAPTAAQNASAPLPVETLLSLSSAVGGETPRWSPDGDRILLGGSNLRLVRAEGGAVSELPVSTGGSGHFLASAEPRWSPDGRWISYVSDRSGTPEIWLWSVEKGEALRLTGNGGRLIKGYSWSPDGRRIAFAGNRHGQYDVWTVEVSSGEARRLTDGPALEVYPAWSPDSQAVLFVRLDGAWMDHTIVEVPAGGGKERVIVRDEDFFDYGEGGTFGHPLVSPDGATVVFPSYRSGWINYWAVPRSGGEPTPLAAAEADQTEGTWSPDGGGFLYVENHGGTYQLRVVPAGGGEPQVIAAPESGIVGAPQWSPDGGRISYTLETPTRPGDL